MKLRTIILFLLFALLHQAVPAAELSEAGLCWFNYKIGGSTPTVFSIYRDPSGRTWLGVNGGLYLFNGYQTYATQYEGKAFKAQVYSMINVGDTMYLGSNDGLFTLDASTGEVSRPEGNWPREIRSLLYVDDTLWIGSLNGLFFYRPDTGELSGPVAGLPHPAVYSLLEVNGDVYIGTYDGLGHYDPTSRRINIVALPDSARGKGGNIFVNSMCADRTAGVIYLGTEGALLAYSPSDGKLNRFAACNGHSVKSLALLPNALAAGTDSGLMLLPDKGEAPLLFTHDARRPYSITASGVWSLMTDSEGNLWAGTDMGLSVMNTSSPVKIYSISDITGSSVGQQVYNILRDSHGSLWLGGNNGIIRCDSGAQPQWFLPATEKSGLTHNRIRDIVETSDGALWCATDGGLHVFDRAANRFVNHRISDRSHRVNANWAYSILEDPADSTLWVAGYLGGIFREKFKRFSAEGQFHTADTVFTHTGANESDFIGSMVRDRDGNKWVLHFRDSELTRISRDLHTGRVPVAAVTGGEPSLLCTDNAGDVWCGFFGGAVRFSPDGTMCDTIVRFPYVGPDESVYAMSAVGHEVWVALTNSVWAIDPATMKPSLLGLPDKTYTSIYYDERTHHVILGTTDEIVVADPRRLRTGRSDERISIFRINRDEIPVTSDFLADAPVEIVALPTDSHNITVDVGTIYFSPASYLRFAYRLDGHGDWILMPESSNRISFSSLQPGKHVLEVSIAGVSGSERLLVFDVALPWYRTALAFVIYAMLFCGLVFLIIMEVRRRNRRRMEEMQRANVLSTVENRLFFLANISHELKTPLSMIIGPLSKIRTGEGAAELNADIETAYQNALKLNALIHQTVEINRMELGSENMMIYSRIDAVEFCRDIFETYRHNTPGRNFVFSSPVAHIYARVDAVKFESLLNNLLSNAVKYTAEGSTIACSLNSDEKELEIAVSDDGVGIPDSEQSLVFQRLYRSPRTAGSHEGTGIGLYLVRQYAELMGGSITLESKVDEGTTFRLRVPLWPPVEQESPDAFEDEQLPELTDKRKRVLIVDDNRSIAAFISSVLSPEYACVTAPNGKAGLTVASSFRPDLVIADEMMPLMSGLEMSRRMKTNPTLSSVPILLLTAKDTPGIHGESISSGVDAFMAKPFEAPVLKAKVEQLIGTTEKIKQSVRLETLTAAAPAESETAAEKQLASVTAVIEANLSNPDLNVDFVCRATGIASKTLYRLIKKFVGVSPVDYIRQTRMRKAAMLLEQQKFSVSEVMYMVGFSSSSYFSKCFAAMFGTTPSQYAAQYSGQNNL